LITFRAIKPGKPFQSSIFREEARVAIKEFTALVRIDFAQTTRTWKDPPKFKEKIQDVGTQSIQMEVFPVPEVPFKFVDEGTRVRRAVMSADFIAKTKPNFIGSRAGRGGVVFIGKNVKRPGIKARNFTKIIKRNNESIFRKAINNALAKFRRRSNREA
jgi:hypothetical protein